MSADAARLERRYLAMKEHRRIANERDMEMRVKKLPRGPRYCAQTSAQELANFQEAAKVLEKDSLDNASAADGMLVSDANLAVAASSSSDPFSALRASRVEMHVGDELYAVEMDVVFEESPVQADSHGGDSDSRSDSDGNYPRVESSNFVIPGDCHGGNLSIYLENKELCATLDDVDLALDEGTGEGEYILDLTDEERGVASRAVANMEWCALPRDRFLQCCSQNKIWVELSVDFSVRRTVVQRILENINAPYKTWLTVQRNLNKYSELCTVKFLCCKEPQLFPVSSNAK